MQKPQTLLYNWEAITSFLPYLKISDLLRSAVISKTWQYNLNQYIKRVLLSEEYEHIHPNPMTALKILYDRKIFIFDNFVIQQKKFPYMIQKISVGNNATCVTNLNQQKYLISQEDLLFLNPNQLVQSPKIKKLNNKYNEVTCIGDYVYCIKDSEIVQYKPTIDNVSAGEVFIDFIGTIDHFLVSFAYCFVCCAELTKQPRYFIFSHKEPKPHQIQLKIPINSVPESIFIGYGANALIISEGTVYQCNLQSEPIKLSPLKMLKGKRISDIKSGKGHFFAFEMKKKPIKQWTNADVINWAQQSGFSDYLKIFKQQNMTGKKLLGMTKLYMEDSLGITGTKTQQKMKMLIEQSYNMHLHPQNYNVYAWGKNDKSQLGINPSSNSNNIIKPKIPQDFYIWKCMGEYTILKKIKGETYLINRVIQNKLHWQTLSQSRIWSIGINKWGAITFCASMSKEKTPQRLLQQPIEHQKRKMKTAKNVIDKIMWDQNLKREDFRVGYMDRYSGMLEIELQEFLKGQVKEYRVYYFKEKGKLVWDRNSRLDIL